VLGDQLLQACLFGDPHHGGQAAERDQIRVVENRLRWCGKLALRVLLSSSG